MLNVSAKWQRAVMLDNDINVNCFTDIVTASGEKSLLVIVSCGRMTSRSMTQHRAMALSQSGLWLPEN